MTADELDKLEALEKVATPGPWKVPTQRDSIMGWSPYVALRDEYGAHRDDLFPTTDRDGALLIAAARNALPELLRLARLGSDLEAERAKEWRDRPLPEDAEIDAAFPTRSGRHDLYAEAMRLVGACRGKFRLVALVTWLLLCAEKKASG